MIRRCPENKHQVIFQLEKEPVKGVSNLQDREYLTISV